MVTRFVSGGQTGADRGALDAAVAVGNGEGIQILNVAGSRNSEAPGIGTETQNILVRAFTE